MVMVTYFCPLLNFSFLGCGGDWRDDSVVKVKGADH